MFNAFEEKEKIVKFIRDYFNENSLGGVVIGISGGKDSGVVAGLFSEAIGSDNVVGVWLPCNSKDSDLEDAKKVSDAFHFPLVTLDLTNVYNIFKDEVTKSFEVDENNLVNSDINLKPRLRMSSLYYLAAMYSSLKNKTYVVAGTGNKCEIYVGYYTKGGDGVSDINVLADLTVPEVIKIGEVLGVPKEVLYKTPDDGLSGKSDEEKLGVKYSDIAKVINGEKVDKEIEDKIRRLHKNNLHKLNVVKYLK